MAAAVKKGTLTSIYLLLSSLQSSELLPLPADLLTLSKKPQFLWVTEFPLFTLADPDKDFQAHGRWSATHHPFTAPVWEDLADLKAGKVEKVSHLARQTRPIRNEGSAMLT